MKSLLLAFLVASLTTACTSRSREPKPCENSWAKDTIGLKPNSIQFPIGDSTWSTHLRAPWTGSYVGLGGFSQDAIIGTLTQPYWSPPESASHRRATSEYLSLTLSGTPTIKNVCNRLEYHYPLNTKNHISFGNSVSTFFNASTQVFAINSKPLLPLL